nr:putative ribonuclease H-like domain-containing protein [Tanacetum cinerariifolium]
MLDYGFNFMNTRIFIDNQSTICIVKNPVFHQRTKHIEIQHHFIKDAYEKNLIQVVKIHTDENVAGTGIKGRNKPKGRLTIIYVVYTNFCAGTGIKGRNKPKGRLTIIYGVYTNFCAGLQCCWSYLFMLMVPTGGCTLPASSYSFILLDWFLLVVWYYFCWSLLVHTVGLVPTGSGTNSAGRY